MWTRLWRRYRQGPWGIDWRGYVGTAVCLLFIAWTGSLLFLIGVVFFLVISAVSWHLSWAQRQADKGRHPVIRSRVER